MKKNLIVYGGAFNPPTKAHLSAMKALSHLAGELILLPSGREFIQRWKPGQNVLPDLVRLDLLKAALEKAQISAEISHLALQENLCTYDALRRLKEIYQADEVCFVIGEDKLEELPKWNHAEELVSSTHFLMLHYAKTGTDTLHLPGLFAPVHVEYIPLPAGTEDIHASSLRDCMRRHDHAILQTDTGRFLAAHPECFRIAACAPQVYLANPIKNADAIIACMEKTDADLLVFPELSIAGATCGDFLHSADFLNACMQGADRIAQATKRTGQIVFFGCPCRMEYQLFNCAAAAHNGKILALIPKTYLDGSIQEQRWFAPAHQARENHVRWGQEKIPFGTDILLQSTHGKAIIAAELGQDADMPIPPSMLSCMAGANIIVNLSAHASLAGQSIRRQDQLRMLSARGICAYAYASPGMGESTSDAVYTGHRMILLNGHEIVQAHQPLFALGKEAIYADIDLSTLEKERMQKNGFADGVTYAYRRIEYDQPTFRFPPKVSAQPFLPQDLGDAQKDHCLEMLDLQSRALCQRIRSIGLKRVVIGISGGLDSTLALIVTHLAFKALQLPSSGIIAVTMPGFATSEKTLKNATDLCRQFGTDFRQVDITDACTLHEKDIGHDPTRMDITYENIQARERTQILMDIANMEGGIVIGTGDLSELALGWCTYNGDHMSHYGVNGGIPKTLVQFIVRTWAMHCAVPDTKDTLLSILHTEITPELVPGGASTEERIGQYALHDFFLYYFMRYGFGKEKLRFLAAETFGAHRIEEIEKTLNTFFSRFFVSQFKRNCLPDGPRISDIGVSPRGDLKLPADCGRNHFTR